MMHLVIPKILILSLIVAFKRSSAQINLSAKSSKITTLDDFKTQTDSNKVNDGLKLKAPTDHDSCNGECKIKICKIACETCENQQFNNSNCQVILQKCNNCKDQQTELKVFDGGESNPISLHQKDHIPEDCRDYKCKYCESIGGNDLLCQKFLLECDGCLFFYGVPDPPNRK